MLASELPSGTVTLLFSDIEGSTSIMLRLADTWASVLQAHRELCRAVWAAYDGHELGTEGDSFFVVFATAEQAVSAAVAAQRAIAAASWPEGSPVRIRIGVHTGSPQRHDEGYVGMDVHKGARIAGAAHGGQTLASAATAALVHGTLDTDLTLTDLGDHALKDIPDRLRLFQVSAPGLPTDFPSLKTLGGTGNLPTLLTPTVGRDGELAELSVLLRDPSARMVTLTGPGGTGKTRLATELGTQIASRYADGVHFVPLSSAVSATDMWSGISQVLDIPATGQLPPGFFDHVAHRNALLVLDNLEQVPDADTVCRALLEQAPHLTLLVTSRRALHVIGEYDHTVPPLEPDGALALFRDYAVRARRGFSLTDDNRRDVEQLCKALDGLPLALEIAAARVRLLTPAAILKRLDGALDLVATDRGRVGRQQTLRHTIAWSYDMLSRPEQCVLDRLGVFEGSASYEAIEGVVPAEELRGADLAEVLYTLVDASLVRITDADDEPRFSLFETIKRFALDRLTDTSRLHSARDCHAQHYYNMAARLYESSRTDAGARQAVLAERTQLLAIVRRPDVSVSDLAYESGSAPHEHLVVLVASCLARGGAFLAASKLAASVLDSRPGVDSLATAVLRVVIADQYMYDGQLDLYLREAGLAMTGLGDHLGGEFRPWVDPVRSRSAAAFAHVQGLMMLGRLDEAEQQLDRLAPVIAADQAGGRSSALGLTVRLHYERGELEQALDVLGSQAEAASSDIERLETINNAGYIAVLLGRRRVAQQRLRADAELACSPMPAAMQISYAETFAVAVGPDHPLICARTFAATSVARVVEHCRNNAEDEAEDERAIAPIRKLVAADQWDAAWMRGKHEQLVDLIREMAALEVVGEVVGAEDG